MTLYELTGEYVELLEMMDSAEPETLSDTLDAIGGEIEDKADGYAKVIREAEGDVKKIEAEIERLIRKKQTINNNVKYMKERLQNAMEATGKRKFKTSLFSFGIQRNPPSVMVTDMASVPKQFWIPQDPMLDKTGLKNYLKANGETEYARLMQTESLRIR